MRVTQGWATALFALGVLIMLLALASIAAEEFRRRRANRDPSAEVLMAALRLHEIAERARKQMYDEINRGDS